MRWLDLLFLHWPLPTDRLQRLLPAGLEIDEWQGSAWLGVVPFRMASVRARWLPPLPGAGAFPELNVRTYVRHRGVPGIWFFSLDAGSWLAVRTARALFRLPYFDARMRCAATGRGVDYECRRTHRDQPPVGLRVQYRARGPMAVPASGSLASWLVERYAMFTPWRDGVRIGHIHHAPWQLADAEVWLDHCDLAAPLGLALEAPPPLQHMAAPQHVAAWLPRPPGP